MSSLPSRGDVPGRPELVDAEPAIGVSQAHNNYHNTHQSKGHGDLRLDIVPGEKDVKLAKDGKTVLIPQPSDDPDDVLNWPVGKKYKVLLSLIFASLVYGTLLFEGLHRLTKDS